MSFAQLDTTTIARALAQIADLEEDVADVYLERREELELPDDREAPGILARREEGFAVRLVRKGLTWLAARDGFDDAELADALRQAARALPSASYSMPRLDVPPIDEGFEAPELTSFPRLVRRRIRESHAAFPLRLRVRRHRRRVQVIGTRLVPGEERELFYSCEARLPWGGYGAVLAALDEPAAERLAAGLLAGFRARKEPPPETGTLPVVLGPAAAAVFLHEAVAHALETDTLVLGGRPQAAIGLELGSGVLNVLDDPGGAPPNVRRSTDDEGIPVTRRWLLREGRVREPLADLFAARASGELTPGAGRRSDRFHPPVPRSTHLELLPGETSEAELLRGAAGGLFLAETSRGRLDPLSGEFALWAPYAWRIEGGERGGLTGPLRLRGRIADLLSAVDAVGSEAEAAGAGWCAKGGQRLAVWATAPALRLSKAEVSA